jgi:hypothetical protein
MCPGHLRSGGGGQAFAIVRSFTFCRRSQRGKERRRKFPLLLPPHCRRFKAERGFGDALLAASNAIWPGIELSNSDGCDAVDEEEGVDFEAEKRRQRQQSKADLPPSLHRRDSPKQTLVFFSSLPRRRRLGREELSRRRRGRRLGHPCRGRHLRRRRRRALQASIKNSSGQSMIGDLSNLITGGRRRRPDPQLPRCTHGFSECMTTRWRGKTQASSFLPPPAA